MENKHRINAKGFKAFCDENRLQKLALQQSGEKCACVLMEDLKIKQPTLCHHMKILCESGIVTGRKEGKWTYYSVDESGSQYAIGLLQRLTTVVEDNTVYGGYCK